MPQCASLQQILQARTLGMQCDVNFRDRAGVANSEFIRLSARSDSRVRTLVVAMRYFFKVHGLAGGGCGLKLSTYALTLIVIMFLQ